MATNPTIGFGSNAAALRPEPIADQRTAELPPGAEAELVAEGPDESVDPSIQAILASDSYDDDSALASGSGIDSVVAHLSPEHGNGV